MSFSLISLSILFFFTDEIPSLLFQSVFFFLKEKYSIFLYFLFVLKALGFFSIYSGFWLSHGGSPQIYLWIVGYTFIFKDTPKTWLVE